MLARHKKMSFTDVAVVVAAISFFWAVFIPLGTFLSNSQEFFNFSISKLLVLSCFVWVGLFSVLVAVLCVAHRWTELVCRRVLTGLSALTLAFYIQGNLINLNYGVLDGHAIPWNEMVGKGVLNTVVWIGVVVLFVWLVEKKRCFTLRLAMGCFCAYLFLLSGLRLMTFHDASSTPATFTEKNFMRFSTDRNVLVFVIDTLDCCLFDELLEKRPHVAEFLSGFTYYHNTIGMFPTTKGAMPHIQTGIPNDNAVTFVEYKDKAYQNSPICQEARKHGYVIDIYSEQLGAPSVLAARKLSQIENLSIPNIGPLDLLNGYLQLVNDSVFAYLPHFVKRYYGLLQFPLVPVPQNEELHEHDVILNGAMRSVDVEKDFAVAVDRGKIDVSGPRCLKFYWFWGVHNPDYTLDKAETVVRMLGTFFERLRKSGLWDNTTIFVMADHGCVCKERPVFLCNDNEGPLRTSELPFSYENLPGVFEQAMAGRYVRIPESKGLRPFWFYMWGKGETATEASAAYLPKIQRRQYDVHCRLAKEGGLEARDTYENQDLSSLGCSNMCVDGDDRLAWLWTIGQRAELELPLRRENRRKAVKLRMHTSALLTEKKKNLRASFRVNGKKCGEAFYSHPGQEIQDVKLHVPQDLNTNDSLTIVFEIDNPVKPSELIPGSPDGRLLGLRIDSFEIADGRMGRKFSFDDVTAKNVVSATGLSRCEPPHGRWIDGDEAEITLAVPPDLRGRPAVLTLEYGVFLSPGKLDSQRVSVAADGTRLVDRVDQVSAQKMLLRLSPEMTADGLVELHFELPDAVVPAQLGVSGDTRRLAILLKKSTFDSVK